MLADRTTDPETERQLLSVRPGDHLCFLTPNFSDSRSTLAPYIHHGLLDGERIVCIGSAGYIGGLRAMARDYGAQPDDAEADGRLLNWCLGPEDPALPDVASLSRSVRAALRDGFAGVRFLIDVASASHAMDARALHAWELALEDVLGSGHARALCLYRQHDLDPATLESGLTSHPLVLLENEVCANAFHHSHTRLPDAHDSGEETISRVEWMLSRLNAIRCFERERHRWHAESPGTELAAVESERVADLYEVANRTADSLAQVNALKDEFLSLVSHELRTPLTVVLGNADLLLREEDAIDRRQRTQALEDIRTESHRMNRLVTNLLSVARLSNDTSQHMKPVMLAPLMRRVIAQHLRAYPNRRIRLTLRETDTPCLGIETLIEQVLVNLVSNAEKYSAADMMVEVGVRDEQGWRIVSVKDHGIGLDSNNINRAFEAFYRSEKAASMSPGLGIGLTVCKRLVEAQGGQIWARSRDGGGAEFSFMLRCAKEEVGAPVATPTS